MNFLSLVGIALLVWLAGLPSFAVAGSATIVLDDSVSMCGYLANDKNTGYETLLQAFQQAIESNNDTVSLSLLDQGMVSSSRPGVMSGLDKIVAGQPLGKIPAKHKTSNFSCAFHANTSLLGDFFSKEFDQSGLAMLVTDFIFDTGASHGGSASQLAFVDEFMNWSQGRAAPQKKPKRSNKSKKPSIEPDTLPSGWENSAGIIALRSAFNGNYYLRQSGSTSVPINIDNRPVYLFWRARSMDLVQRWLRPLLAHLAENQIELTVFQLLPSPALLDPANLDVAHKPNALAVMTDQLQPRVRYANRGYEKALERASKSNKPHDLENPIDSSINPAACFKLQGFSVYYDANCGKGGEREDLFWEHRKIDEIRFEFVLEKDMPGLDRVFTVSSTGFRDNSVHVDFKTDQKGNKVLSVALAKLGSGFFEYRGQQNTEWVIELQEELKLQQNQFDPISVLKDWSSDTEPCNTGDNCKDAQSKTIGLHGFVKSMIARTNQTQANNHVQPSQKLRLEFNIVGQLP